MASKIISALKGNTAKALSDTQQLINESIQDLDKELQAINHTVRCFPQFPPNIKF